MEFPPEIVAIIREYSQPCFKYFREYKRILELKHLSEWPDLQEILLTRPDTILPEMLVFETAQLAFDPVKLYIRREAWSSEDEDTYYAKRSVLIEAEKELYEAVYL